jgi:hypothetical protein
MEPTDEFQDIGKKIPYQVPNDFFDQISAKTLERAKQQKIGPNIQLVIWRSVAVAATLAAIVFLGFLMRDNEKPPEIATVQPINKPEPTYSSGREQKNQELPVVEPVKKDAPRKLSSGIKNTEDMNDVLADLSDEELMQLAAMYQSDLFMDEAMQ